MDLQNYHEWIAERQRLLERIKELEAENAELRKRLGEDVVPIKQEPNAMQTLSLQEKVGLFRSLFRGREDVFARRWFSKATGKVCLTSLRLLALLSVRSIFGFCLRAAIILSSLLLTPDFR